MKDLSLEELCRGMLAVRDNAVELLQDAKLLRHNGRISRAYALAYMACEEAGKLPILLGVATRLASGVAVDWKQAKKRFQSHSSKASQFFGMAKAMPMLLEAVASGQKTVDSERVMLKAAVGVFLGPTLFESRNAAIYCDFGKEKFVTPAEQIDEAMADTMLQFAETNVASANGILNKSAEEVAAAIRARASRERYEERQAHAAQLAQEMLAVVASRISPEVNDE